MLGVPLSSVPSQSFQMVLDGQDCNIEILTRGERLYMNLAVNGIEIQNGAICINKVAIIQKPTNVFSGNFIFIDTLGESDPKWNALDSRYYLVYLSADELKEI